MALSIKDLDPIDDPKIIQRYLQYTIDLHEEILCLVKESNLSFKTRLAAAPNTALELVLSAPTDIISSASFLKLINETTDRQINISFKAQDSLFVGRCNFKLAQPKQITVRLLAPLYKLQRRQNQRFKPSTETPCFLRLPEDLHPMRKLKLTLNDVSASGFSIHANQLEAEFFSLGKQFGALTFVFCNQSFAIDVRVASQIQRQAPKSQDAAWRIGFKFLKPPTKLEQLLAKEAYVYTQRIFARRI